MNVIHFTVQNFCKVSKSSWVVCQQSAPSSLASNHSSRIIAKITLFITKTICSENKCILYGPFLKCRISAWLEFLHYRYDLIHFLQQLNNVTCLFCWKGRIDQLRRDVKKTARINKRDYPADVLDVDTHSPTMGTGPSINDVISKKSATFDHLPPPLLTFPIT